MRVIRYLATALALSGIAFLGVSAAAAATTEQTTAQKVTGLRADIRHARAATWRYQDRAGVPRTRTEHVERRTRSIPFLTWVRDLWTRRRAQAARRAHRRRPAAAGIAHLSLWLCIHRGEGAWNANTGNGYYGGLQMTAGWYGGPGHLASSDPPSVQMGAAERGYRASGYSTAWLEGQWPNTSPPCLNLA